MPNSTPPSFSVSHQAGAGDGWLELLGNGLTFDLAGLAPAPAQDLPQLVYRYGFASGHEIPALESITLRPSAHLAGGANLMPVVRSMAGIAADLCALADVAAIAWHPARSAMEPAYFARVISKWLEGGPFPALGLTALARDIDGGLRSEGLAFFTGQELRIEPIPNANPAQAGKIAVRLIHSLVSMAAIASPCDLSGPEGERLVAEPSGNGRFLRVWQKS